MYIVYCLFSPDDEDHSGEGEDRSEDSSGLMIYKAEYWSLVCEGIEKEGRAGDEEEAEQKMARLKSTLMFARGFRQQRGAESRGPHRSGVVACI